MVRRRRPPSSRSPPARPRSRPTRGGGTEATALQGAKLSLIDAIKIAEQQTGGQAYDAGVAKADRHVRIMVETNGPKGIQTVAIDAQSGQVVATHAGGEPD